MKKYLLSILILCTIGLCGCDDESEKQYGTSFIKIESGYTWDIVYHRDTKVMYVVSKGFHNEGEFTLLVNPDGSPIIYTEDKK